MERGRDRPDPPVAGRSVVTAGQLDPDRDAIKPGVQGRRD